MSNSNNIYFVIKKDDLKLKLFDVFPNGSFSEVEILFIRIDQVVESPLRMVANQEENSLTINEKYGILFKDSFGMEEFLNELYFTMEEYHDIPIHSRTTSKNTNIEDITKELSQNYYKEK